MLMVIVLPQRESDNQWNGLPLKWVTPAGNPEWSKLCHILIPNFKIYDKILSDELLYGVSQLQTHLLQALRSISFTSSHVFYGLVPYCQLCIKFLMFLAELHYLPHQSDKGRNKAPHTSPLDSWKMSFFGHGLLGCKDISLHARHLTMWQIEPTRSTYIVS